MPPGSLLEPHDVRLAAATVRSARLVLVQLQQPGPAVLEAARLGGRPALSPEEVLDLAERSRQAHG